MNNKKLLQVMGIGYGLFVTLAVMILAGWFVYRTSAALKFSRDFDSRIYAAVSSVTAPAALRELDQAIAYLEARNLTAGYTTLKYETPRPEENLGALYAKLIGWRTKLSLGGGLEVVNQMKHDLTKPDSDSPDGFKVVTPPGISIFPHNTLACFLFYVGLFGAILGSPLFDQL